MFHNMKSIITNRVSTRIGSGFLLLFILMLGCAGAGYYGLLRFGSALAFISGPAWETADGTMEGVIEIEGQMLAVRQLLAGEDETAMMKMIDERSQAAKEAFAQVAAANLTSKERLADLETEIENSNKSLQLVLNSQKSFHTFYSSYSEQQTKLLEGLNPIQEFFKSLSTKSKLVSNLDESFANHVCPDNPEMPGLVFELSTILGDLRSLVQENIANNNLDISANAAKFEQSTERAQQLLSNLVVLSQKQKQVDPDYVRLEKGAIEFQSIFTNYAASSKELLARVNEKKSLLNTYVKNANSLLEFIDVMESEGDAVVDVAAAEVAPLQRSMGMLIASFAFGSILVSLLAATLCTRAITIPIQKLVQGLKEFGDGNLTVQMDLRRTDELGTMADTFNTAAQKIQTMVQKLNSTSKELACSAVQVSSTAVELANGVHRTTDQTALVNTIAATLSGNMDNVTSTSTSMTQNIDSVSSSIHEMTATISEIAQVTQKYATDVSATRELAESTNERMQGLLKAANAINNVVELIDDLAEQTNLLALNATIEAARAGEAGKGFAVVATEVKDLAKQTAMATADIRSSIQSVQQATQEAVQSIESINQMIVGMNQTTDRIAAAIEQQSMTTRSMSDHMSSTTESVLLVARNVQESTVASQQIATSIAEVDRVANESAANANQFVDAGERLQTLANEIGKLMEQFEV